MPSEAEIYRRILDCAGTEYLNRCKGRAFTLHVFQANFSALQIAYTEFENPDKSMQFFHESPAGLGTAAHMELLRHLHNFLAAAKSLVDHTRVFIEDHYLGAAIESTYKRKIAEELENDGVIRFVHDLRNYMLHRSLPPASMTLSVKRPVEIGPGVVSTTVYTDRDKLLEWSRWTSKARDYLCNQSPKFKIIDFCLPYAEKIYEFSSWFDSELTKYHSADLAELDTLKKQLSEFQRTR
jgi:hypothetical protein